MEVGVGLRGGGRGSGWCSWEHFSDRQFAVTVTRMSRFSPTFRLALVLMFRMRAPPPFCQKEDKAAERNTCV